MRINAKDVAAGLMLVVLAAIGLWLNRQYDPGTASRMGAGYMPMLAFSVQLFIGAVVLLVGLFNGPDPLERWAWRPMLFILAAMCAFALLLNKAGLLLTIAVTVGIASFADKTNRPAGVIGLIVFLVILCWFVFIRQLDIRINVWPIWFVRN
jgi:Tripartite tricarboxylate transporter TctB family